MEQGIEAKIKKILADKLNIDVKKIDLDSSLTDDLGIDSFGAIEMTFELEEKLGLKILDDDLKQMKTVKDIVNYIKNQTNKK